MSNFLKQALFIIPILVLIAIPVVLQIKNKDSEQSHESYTSNSGSDSSPMFMKLNPFSSPKEKKDYSMQEPFSADGSFSMTYPMRKSMDPSTWMQMMTTMMSPHAASPVAVCSSCHEGEDLTRYQKQFGPMLQSSWDQYKTMMDPHAMGQMMNPMMMTQMMHQMMSIPMQMMMPFANQGFTMNPQSLQPSSPSTTLQVPMSPEEYEKWYEQQRERLKEHN